MSADSTVVIADDDADIRALIALSVTKAGAVVAADVSTGSAALQVIQDCLPDLAILDISMPEMTGLQVCRALRADPATRDIRIMLLSAAVHPDAVAEGGKAGADAYEAKPFSPRKLSVRIQEMLRARPTGSVRTDTAPQFAAPEG